MPVVMKFSAKHLQQFGRRVGAATARAMNKAGVTARAAGARAVAGNIGLKVGGVKKEIMFKRATADNLVGELFVRGRRIPLIVFDARGRVFLHKRSMTKDLFPGRWDSSCAGHVGAGEDYDGTSVRAGLDQAA